MKKKNKSKKNKVFSSFLSRTIDIFIINLTIKIIPIVKIVRLIKKLPDKINIGRIDIKKNKILSNLLSLKFCIIFGCGGRI